MKFPLGLRNCSDMPQEYILSEILAGYRAGYKNQFPDQMIIKAVDSEVKSDGHIDISVPARYIPSESKFEQVKKRFRLAFKVLKGEASILYYK